MARYKIDCCRDCPDRKPGCHGSCETYKQQKQEYEQTKEEKMKQAKIQQGLDEYKFDFGHKVTKKQIYRGKFRKGY